MNALLDWLLDREVWEILGLLFLTIAVVAGAVVVWDHNYGVVEGEVIEKGHDSEWVQLIPVTVGQTTVMQPIPHPERWKLLVDGVDRFGRARVQWRDVSRSEWIAAKVGDRYRR